MIPFDILLLWINQGKSHLRYHFALLSVVSIRRLTFGDQRTIYHSLSHVLYANLRLRLGSPAKICFQEGPMTLSILSIPAELDRVGPYVHHENASDLKDHP